MNWVDYLKWGLAAIAGALSWFFGGFDVIVTVLVAFIVIDYATGVIAGAITGQLSSAVGFKGILKKVCILLMVGVGVLLDRYIGQPVCRTMVCTFYIVNEALSILENLGRAGVAYPAKLKDIILLLNKKQGPGKPGTDEEE